MIPTLALSSSLPLREPRTLSMLYLTVSPVPALYLALLHLHPAFHSAISHTPCLSSPLAFYPLSTLLSYSFTLSLRTHLTLALLLSALSTLHLFPLYLSAFCSHSALPSVTLFYLSNSIFIISLSFCSLSLLHPLNLRSSLHLPSLSISLALHPIPL